MNEADKSHEALNKNCLLPVTKEAVRLALGEIVLNPGKILNDEGAIISSQNPEIHNAILTQQQISPTPRELITGALWAHLILREQANLKKMGVPKVSEGLYLSFFKDLVDSAGDDEKLSEFNLRMFKRLCDEEPELGKAIKEMTKYLPDPHSYFAGASMVYFMIKKAIESKNLADTFGFS